MKRRILARAARDLAKIESHISKESHEAAISVASRLKKAFALVTDRPEVGRPTSFHGIREWSVPGLPYVIPYRIRGDLVEILRVFHSSRQRPRRWIS